MIIFTVFDRKENHIRTVIVVSLTKGLCWAWRHHPAIIHFKFLAIIKALHAYCLSSCVKSGTEYVFAREFRHNNQKLISSRRSDSDTDFMPNIMPVSLWKCFRFRDKIYLLHLASLCYSNTRREKGKRITWGHARQVFSSS